MLTGARDYLSVGQFAAAYGQSEAGISALTSYLARYGIKSDVYADHLDVVATGTAGQFDQALSVTQHQYRVPALPGGNGPGGGGPGGGGPGSGRGQVPAQVVHGTAQSPRLPYRLAHFVLAVLGLTNYAPYASHTAHINARYVSPRQGGAGCLALTGLTNACHLPTDFATNYGLNGLYHRGADGSGQTAAIVTLAAVDPDGPQHFWQQIAHIPDTGRTLSVQDVDGGPGAPNAAAGSGETDLDVEQAGALAPGANVIVYQAPNTDPGFADGEHRGHRRRLQRGRGLPGVPAVPAGRARLQRRAVPNPGGLPGGRAGAHRAGRVDLQPGPGRDRGLG